MDLRKSITYNGFTHAPATAASAGAPLAGCPIKEINFSRVPGFAYTDKRALHDGLDAIDIFLGGRFVDIVAAVYGSTLGDLFDRKAELFSAYNPVIAYAADTAQRGFLAFDYYTPTADISTWPTSSFPDGIPMRMLLRPTDAPEFDLEENLLGGHASRGGSIPVRIRMLARDPRQYLQTQTSLSVTTSPQTASHRGTFPSPPTLNWTMIGAGSSSYTITIDSFSVRLDLSTVTTGSFSLSFGDGHIRDANGASRDDLFKDGFTQQFADIQPGGSTVVHTANTNISSPSLVWREAWL